MGSSAPLLERLGLARGTLVACRREDHDVILGFKPGDDHSVDQQLLKRRGMLARQLRTQRTGLSSHRLLDTQIAPGEQFQPCLFGVTGEIPEVFPDLGLPV